MSPGSQEPPAIIGWAGPGWYFWDETDAYAMGPYCSAEKATEEMGAYFEYLHE